MTRAELKLTNTLVEASRIEEFDFSKYEDAYVQRLTELIQKKIDGEEIVQVRDAEEPKILNLMDALKKSVAAAQSGRKMAKSAKRGRAAAKKKKTPGKRKSG